MHIRKVERICRLAIAGLHAKRISEITKWSKGFVSKKLRQLEQGGYLICINPKERPKFYQKTEKILPKQTILKDQMNDKFPRLSHRLEIVQIQKSSFKCIITSPPTKAVWDKEYQWNKFTEVQQYTYPFKDLGSVKFRRITTSKKDLLIIILPRFLIKIEELGNIEDILLKYAKMTAMWIKKKFNMPLTDPVLCQKPEYSHPAKEPELIDAIKQIGTFRIDNIRCDSSPPHNIEEFESTDKRDIINYLDTINQMKHIKELAIANKTAIESIIGFSKVFGENQTRIIDFIGKNQLKNKTEDFSPST